MKLEPCPIRDCRDKHPIHISPVEAVNSTMIEVECRQCGFRCSESAWQALPRPGAGATDIADRMVTDAQRLKGTLAAGASQTLLRFADEVRALVAQPASTCAGVACDECGTRCTDYQAVQALMADRIAELEASQPSASVISGKVWVKLGAPTGNKGPIFIVHAEEPEPVGEWSPVLVQGTPAVVVIETLLFNLRDQMASEWEKAHPGGKLPDRVGWALMEALRVYQGGKPNRTDMHVPQLPMPGEDHGTCSCGAKDWTHCIDTGRDECHQCHPHAAPDTTERKSRHFTDEAVEAGTFPKHNGPTTEPLRKNCTLSDMQKRTCTLCKLAAYSNDNYLGAPICKPCLTSVDVLQELAVRDDVGSSTQDEETFRARRALQVAHTIIEESQQQSVHAAVVYAETNWKGTDD